MLSLFHPVTAAWFAEEVGVPTEVQARSWPLIAAGRHVLLTAPTGSGKTLTAFLWALDRFARGEDLPGGTRVLYVSPLKALNNDIQRNLLAPLERLRARFQAAGLPFPDLDVQVRSGDTPAPQRRRMLKRPPEILITTPESLNLLLLGEAGRESLRGVRTVILDEIHAVAGTKRGTHLITAVDRLVPLAGEFQRIAISATVKPLDVVAAWMAGYRREGAEYVPRPVEIVESRAPKAYRLQVRYPIEEGAGRPRPPRGASAAAPQESLPEEDEAGIWERMATEIKALVGQARSTLVFANNRRLSERLARLLNEGEATPIAYAHHGSLSREIRAVVEARMKEGRLPAIVATSSLELGIDIGALDQVVLVETPGSVAAGLQRLGRAGHGVGQESRGVLFASHGRDLLAAAVVVPCLEAGDIEPVRPVENPLDILAQILVAMAASGEWTVDGLFDAVRASQPFHRLPRRQFDLVLEMLAGRYQESRIPELKPRLAIDAVDGTVRASKGARLLVSLSGGTIPDRGYFALRHAGSGAKIGELDEEFVWERREGELFSLGSQSWRITGIGANDVEVVPAERNALLAPFWRAEERDRDPHFSDRLAAFLEDADGRLEDPAFLRDLVERRRLDPFSAGALKAYLARQKEATASPLPHRHLLLIEDCGEAPGVGGRQVVLHAVWGGRLTRPWSYALAAAYEERMGGALEIVQTDDALLLRMPPGEPALPLLDLVHPGNLEDLLRRKLERTGWFAAHFRENAARALLLPRSTARSRVPLWLNRQRSRKLLEAVSGFGDFPLVLETWRECLRDEFALDALKARLEELHAGTVKVREARTPKPSPFAEGLMWKQTNQFMYERDQAAAGRGRAGAQAGTRPDLLREIAFSSPLRPKVPREIIRAFEAKAQRLAPGYAPQGPRELVEWAKERLLVPRPEWEALLAAAGPGPGEESPAGYLASRLLEVTLPGAAHPALAAVERLPSLLAALGIPASGASRAGLSGSPEALAALERLSAAHAPARSEADDPLDGLLVQWLRAYGPLPVRRLAEAFGEALPRVEESLARLVEGDRVLLDALSEDGGTEVCEAGNLETLLRLMRRRSRPALKALTVDRLPLFAAAWQGLAAPARDVEGLQEVMERLFGFPAPAAAWEGDLLPARAMPYQTAWLDALFRDSDLLWFGAGKERVAFAFPEDLELFLPGPAGEAPAAGTAGAVALETLSRAAPARLDFQALAARLPLPSSSLAASLWDLAWQGRITNDTFAALRRGVETGFKVESPEGAAPAPARRSRFQRWKATRPLAGSWLALDPGESADLEAAASGDDGPDPLEREELAKDRARQLLRRHGLLFRELLVHELPALQWGRLFRALRLMELSGEVLSGHFFDGIQGLQFLSPSALPLLEDGLPEKAIYWMSAADPASPCGLGLEGLPYALPPRAAGNHLVFHGPALALVSRRQGRDLSIQVPPRHPYLASYLGSLRHLVERAFMPLKAMEVETINGVAAVAGPYLDDLIDAGFEKGFKTVSLRRRYA